jgi:integration host factor subunit alpha
MSRQTVTRTHLSEAVFQEIGLSRSESGDLLDTVLSKISDALADGNSVKISSFGTFTIRNKRERIGRNPKTGEEVLISPRKVVIFKPSQILKSKICGIIEAEPSLETQF